MQSNKIYSIFSVTQVGRYDYHAGKLSHGRLHLWYCDSWVTVRLRKSRLVNVFLIRIELLWESKAARTYVYTIGSIRKSLWNTVCKHGESLFYDHLCYEYTMKYNTRLWIERLDWMNAIDGWLQSIKLNNHINESSRSYTKHSGY